MVYFIDIFSDHLTSIFDTTALYLDINHIILEIHWNYQDLVC